MTNFKEELLANSNQKLQKRLKKQLSKLLKSLKKESKKGKREYSFTFGNLLPQEKIFPSNTKFNTVLTKYKEKLQKEESNYFDFLTKILKELDLNFTLSIKYNKWIYIRGKTFTGTGYHFGPIQIKITW